MSAAKERDSFYDAALSSDVSTKVNEISVTTTAVAWAGVAGRQIRLKRISLGILLNASFAADDDCLIVLRDSPTTLHIPLASFADAANAGDVAIRNLDLKEGILFPEGKDVLVAISGATVTGGNFTVVGNLLGELV